MEEVAESLKYLGMLLSLSHSMDEFYKIDKLHTLLLEYFKGPYRTDEIVANLSMKCEDLLIRCQWRYVDVECAEIFSMEKAWLGTCCMFNFDRPVVMQNG